MLCRREDVCSGQLQPRQSWNNITVHSGTVEPGKPWSSLLDSIAHLEVGLFRII